MVSETSYTYERTGTPLVTDAFKFEYLTQGIQSYLKYKIYTSTSELNQQVTNKVYDLNSTSLSQETDVSYSYLSPYHKLPTETTTHHSDGTSETNHIKYSKDYVITTINDVFVDALKALQLQNVNTPIETFNDVLKNGNQKVTSAQLVKYNSWGSPTLYLPYKTLQFFDQNGVTYSSFTPSTITGGYFVNDSKYIVTENVLMYDKHGFTQSKNDNHKQVQTSLADLDTHLPLATVFNAAANEIAYYSYGTSVSNANFEVVAGSVTTTPGRTVQSSLAMIFHASNILEHTVTKNVNANNYIFSIWIGPAVGGTINIVLTGADNVPHTYPLTYTSAAEWKYYELKLPVSSLSAVFKTEIKPNLNTLPIDDILFYPENAEISTYKYDAISQAKIADTNTNGVSAYYMNDAAGRLELVYDQDKNVTQRKTYGYPNNTGTFYDPTFSTNDYTGATTATLLTFSSAFNYNTCQFAGVK